MDEIKTTPDKPELIDLDGNKAAALPPDWKLVSLDRYLPPPEKQACIGFFTPDSLDSYIAARLTTDRTLPTRIYVDEVKHQIVAIFDDGDLGGPQGQRIDRAFYKADLDDRFVKWAKASTDQHKQASFLEFIEDNADDIVDPSASTLGTFVNTLRLKKAVTWTNQESQTGAADVTLEYTTKTEAVEQITVPQFISILLPVFRGGGNFKIECRLRFSLDEGAIMFRVVMPAKDKIIRTAWEDLIGVFQTNAGKRSWEIFDAEAPIPQQHRARE